jgi:chemotaxis protein methyltransferase CheR
MAFEEGGRFRLRPEFRRSIEFRQQDIRRELPDGPFSLILCRNVVFTYFEEKLQREIAVAIHQRLIPEGVLVLGRHEALPAGVSGFTEPEPSLPIYCRNALAAGC